MLGICPSIQHGCAAAIFSLLYLPLTPPSYTSTTPPTLLVNSFISDIDQYVTPCYHLPLFPIYTPPPVYILGLAPYPLLF